MKRALAGATLAVLVGLVALGLPTPAQADGGLVISGSVSTSYAGQSGYTVNVFNPVEGTVRATVSNSGVGTTSLSCTRLSPDGLGAWRCRLGSGRLAPGAITVNASSTPKSGGKVLRTSKSGTVSVKALTVSGPGTVAEGETFTVSGTSDLTVTATVSGGGSSLGCSKSGSRYTCSIRATASVTGTSATNTVTVTERGPGSYSKSRSTTVTVLGPGVPSAPSFFTPSTVSNDKQPLTIKGSTNGSFTVQVLVDPAAARNWGGAISCSSTGSWSCPLTQNLSVGKHTIVARAVDAADPTRVSGEAVLRLTIKAVKAPTPKPTPTPTPTPIPLPPVEVPPVVAPAPPTTEDQDVAGGLSNILELLVLGLALVTLARPGALTRPRTSSSASFTGRNPDEVSELEPVGWGDQSPTWAAFGTDATDYWSRTAPVVIAPFSPFLTRLSTDGVGFRAMFGSLWWLLQAGGITLGVMAAADTGFAAAPPSFGLLAGIVVLSCFDALAGFLASITFAILVSGDLGDGGLAVVVVLGLLWTALPLVADLIRPLRRIGQGWTYRWDRLADAVIAALVCGWLAQRLADGIDAFAGTSTGLAADADSLAVIAGAAIVGRVLLGTVVDLGYPERLRATEVFEDLPEPRIGAVVAGFVIRMALFTILGHALIGSCWQLWVGLLLFALPDLLVAQRTRSALAPTLRTGLPAGITEILALVVWCSLLITLVIAQADGDLDKLKYAFVVAGLLPAAFGIAQVMADPDAVRPQTSWRLQLVGAGIVAATAALALHGWNY
ncbi:MAG: hypothetical protein NTV23_00985 [Propionibacteriales bacterium]|nr:hypothetical protein [Propionibacteriales bacterium]